MRRGEGGDKDRDTDREREPTLGHSYSGVCVCVWMCKSVMDGVLPTLLYLVHVCVSVWNGVTTYCVF